jgi:alkanesulfonate monooxygenase SsuD/methylene tetrahydromethanopterin reductase-like flavin-dependent oxidoreductase (luciferase family)
VNAFCKGRRGLIKELHMRYGITLPYEDDPRALVDIAVEAEAAGWDGVFVWDGITWNDAWVTLAAVAACTKRVRLGAMLTPISRRRPWKLAQESATLDRLSNGRLIQPVGLGAPETGFAKFGEETDRKIRAQLLDEGLDILNGLWSGQPFSYQGQHYQIDNVTFAPTPHQSPRIPIWVVGAWPRMKSMRRVLRCDGILPAVMDEQGQWRDTTPDDIRAIKQYVEANRIETTPFDIVMEGETPGDDPAKAAAIIGKWAEAGVTWWLENVWATPREQGGLEGMRARTRQGPPGGER